MSIYVEKFIYCDQCGATKEIEDDLLNNYQIRNDIQQSGWLCIGDMDYCEVCADTAREDLKAHTMNDK